MAATKLTKKYQTTVPEPIREFLSLGAGDQVMWEIEDDKVVIKKVTPFDVEYAKALEGSLSEWNSKNDDDAYRDL